MRISVCCVSLSAVLIKRLGLIWKARLFESDRSQPTHRHHHWKSSAVKRLYSTLSSAKKKLNKKNNNKQTEVLQLQNTVAIHEESRQKAHLWHHFQKETKNKMHCKTSTNNKKHKDRGGGGGVRGSEGGRGGTVGGGGGRGGGLWQTCGSLIKQLVLASALHLDSETFRSGVVYDTSAWPATVLLQRIHNTDTATSKNIYTRATKAPIYTDVCVHIHIRRCEQDVWALTGSEEVVVVKFNIVREESGHRFRAAAV